jgi:hypothetical protein
MVCAHRIWQKVQERHARVFPYEGTAVGPPRVTPAVPENRLTFDANLRFQLIVHSVNCPRALLLFLCLLFCMFGSALSLPLQLRLFAMDELMTTRPLFAETSRAHPIVFESPV